MGYIFIFYLLKIVVAFLMSIKMLFRVKLADKVFSNNRSFLNNLEFIIASLPCPEWGFEEISRTAEIEVA